MILPRICYSNQHLELWFVLEVPVAGTVSKVYITQPSVHQFYRTCDLHECNHFQINCVTRLQVFVDRMEENGLTYLCPGAVDATSADFFTILAHDDNYVLPDITVINMFSREGQELVRSVGLEELGRHVLSNNVPSSGDDRNNLRTDIGFSAQSYTDREVVEGMVAPRFTTRLDGLPGMNNDTSLTQSIMKASIALKGVVEEVQGEHQVNWEDDFSDATRSNLFSHRIAAIHGIEDPTQFVVEGCSLGVTGLLPSGDYKILQPHMDRMNGRVDGYNVYWGLSVYVKVQYPGWACGAWVRIALGCYGKKSVDDFMRRLSVNSQILDDVRSWMDNHPELLSVDHTILRFRGGHNSSTFARVPTSLCTTAFLYMDVWNWDERMASTRPCYTRQCSV